MKKDLLSLIRSARETGLPVIWDGAVGTQLIARGLIGEIPEYWNIERPEVITEIHADYFAAGANVVQTNTFGGNRFKLSAAGLDEKLEQINRTAAELARKACPEHGFVAGDIGPTGKMLVPSGDLTVEEAEDAFAEQAEALLKGGVDLFSIETMFDIQEARAAIKGVHRVSDIPIVAEMTFNKTSRGYFTVMGVSPAEAIKGMEDAGADVVGANCTIGIEDMVVLVRAMRETSSVPLIAQANAGKPELKEGQTIYHDTPDNFAGHARELFEAGASAIGSCCGTTPEFTAAIKAVFY